MTPAEEAEWVAGFVEWSQETVDGSDALQVVESQGRVIGRIRIERDEAMVDGRTVRRITLCGLQLDPTVQRRGIGTAIVKTLQHEVSVTDGVLDLGVEHDNPGARRLYDRLGFDPVGADDREVHLRWRPPGFPE
ncbi:GNAT family N-acetyltransferase [Flexivirga oryzae]|uniref:GNAT family N-acetyltransferase n=1 Tax=Flexivirga oryzae TaxID=1794944 RepID=UPI003CCE0F52